LAHIPPEDAAATTETGTALDSMDHARPGADQKVAAAQHPQEGVLTAPAEQKEDELAEKPEAEDVAAVAKEPAGDEVKLVAQRAEEGATVTTETGPAVGADLTDHLGAAADSKDDLLAGKEKVGYL
jgi:hypothetical protein